MATRLPECSSPFTWYEYLTTKIRVVLWSALILSIRDVVIVPNAEGHDRLRLPLRKSRPAYPAMAMQIARKTRAGMLVMPFSIKEFEYQSLPIRYVWSSDVGGPDIHQRTKSICRVTTLNTVTPKKWYRSGFPLASSIPACPKARQRNRLTKFVHELPRRFCWMFAITLDEKGSRAIGPPLVNVGSREYRSDCRAACAG